MTRRSLALLACVAPLALAGCGGDDENAGSTASETTAQTATEPPPTATTKAPAPAKQRKRPVVNRREAAVQRTFNEFVEAYELSDQAKLCSLLGQPGADAESCARRAGVNLMLLPSSEELSVDRTDFNGSLARLTLSSGAQVTLRRTGGKLIVIGLGAP